MHSITKITPLYAKKVDVVTVFFTKTDNKLISYSDLINELMPRLGVKDSNSSAKKTRL